MLCDCCYSLYIWMCVVLVVLHIRSKFVPKKHDNLFAVFILGFFHWGPVGPCLRNKWGHLKKIRAIDFNKTHHVYL